MIRKLGVSLVLIIHFTSAEWVNVTDVSEVEKNGILAGTNHGDNVYVGRAFSSNRTPEPGALYLSSYPGGVPVVKYAYGDYACNETKGIQYLKIDPKCRYVWFPSKESNQVEKAVEVLQGGKTTYIGRLERHGGVQVGKVQIFFPHCTFYYAHGDKQFESYEYYEVLTCT